MKTVYSEQRVSLKKKDDVYPNFYSIDKINKPELMFTEEECDRIIALSETVESVEASTGYFGIENFTKKDNRIRSATIYPLDAIKETQWIYEKLIDVVNQVNDEYFQYGISHILSPLNLICYNSDSRVKGHYDWHNDTGSGDASTRKISVSIQLSDPNDYTGCDLIYVGPGQIIASRERGSIAMFPSYGMHRVNPVDTGKRYALVTWIHGPDRFR